MRLFLTLRFCVCTCIKALLLGVFCNIPDLVVAQPSGSVTQGAGTLIHTDLLPSCPSNHKTPLGSITSSDQKKWLVPSDSTWLHATKLADLYNTCNNFTPAKLSDLDLSKVPVVVVNPGGDTISGYLFCDNYVELYINGTLIGVDAIPFTPFNASVARFVVSKPYTIAVKLVDWEEHPGLGTEIQNSSTLYHPGDGGFIAAFSDGTVTDASWKTQCFYMAPFDDPNTIDELPNGVHSSARSGNTPTCTTNCYGVHYEIPEAWNTPGFSDAGWPNAFLYDAAQVTNQPAYTNFAASAWGKAKFIWSSNLILDNVVLSRKQVGSTNAALQQEMQQSLEVVLRNAHDLHIIAHQYLQRLHIRLLDASGREIAAGNIHNLEAGEVYPFELNSIHPAAGVYVLVIDTERGRTSRRIVLGGE